MTLPDAEIESRVKAVVASALDVPIGEVRNHSSLIDDLNAESIDFIDIVFRLETEFGMTISEDEIWRGSFDGTDDAAIANGVARMKARMPEFRWDRLPADITKAQLPSLITVQTVVDYMRRQLDRATPA
jgi:acyl carrier protein